MSETKKIHFIGIGGVGMSGIAHVAHDRGLAVSGSDMKESRATIALKNAGIEVFIGHDAANIASDVDIVVISSAISEKNPELCAARVRGIEVWHRSEMLAELGRTKKTLACAGTHGKTTSSSMLATTIDRLGLDPTFLIGGTVDGYNSNAKSGTGEYYIVEADESDGSFVHLNPYIALITNIEPDHLDHYGTLEAIYDAFEDFLCLLADEGCAVVCANNPHLRELARAAKKRCVTYGDKSLHAADVTYTVTGRVGIGHSFSVAFPDGRCVQTSISKNPGRHNVENATGVLAVCWVLGLDVADAAAALATFSGVRRRFDLIDEVGGITIVDDYAHHPTEIKATLAAARELDFRRIHVLFQPHRYTRTALLADLFGDAFEACDSVCVMDVYPAGESPIPGVSGKTVIDAILAHDARAQLAWMPHRLEIIPYLVQKLEPGDLVITMGAGDVTSIGPELASALRQKNRLVS